MKSKLTALFIVVALFATLAFAATGSARLDVPSTAKIADKTLVPGEYSVSWSGEGDKVEVIIKKKKNEIVKTTAKLVELKTASTENFMLKNSDGTVKEMYFVGKTASLVF